jgi:hypothetical protein
MPPVRHSPQQPTARDIRAAERAAGAADIGTDAGTAAGITNTSANGAGPSGSAANMDSQQQNRPDMPLPGPALPNVMASTEQISQIVLALLRDNTVLSNILPQSAPRQSHSFADLLEVAKLGSGKSDGFTADELDSLPDVITPGMAGVPIAPVKRFDLYREVSKKNTGKGSIRPGSLLHELPVLLSTCAVHELLRNCLFRTIQRANSRIASQSADSPDSIFMQEMVDVLEGPMTFLIRWASELQVGRRSSIEEFIEHGAAVSDAYTLGRFKPLGSEADDVRSSMRASIQDAKVKALAKQVRSQFSAAADSDSDSANDQGPKHSTKHKHKQHKHAAKHSSHTAGKQPAAAQ